MTYQEKYDELLKKADEAWRKLLEVDKEMTSINGFADIDLGPKYDSAYRDWQLATNNLNAFVSSLKGMDINPSKEMS